MPAISRPAVPSGYVRQHGEKANYGTEDAIENLTRNLRLNTNKNTKDIASNPLAGGRVMTIDIGTPGLTGVIKEITHGLGRSPVGCIVVNMIGDGTPANTAGIGIQMYEKSKSTAKIRFGGILSNLGDNVKVTIIIF